MKKLFIISMLALLGLSVNAQTPVSGGIYTNTTWTLALSPYIVTDTVVVFPGVTLTIQPGVTVKFDNATLIEVRGKIIALGTNADSITFTSNSVSPTPGIYYGIENTSDTLANKYSYCAFKYATYGIGDESSYDTLIIKHSNFYNNINGINDLYGNGAYNIVDTCNFYNNTICGVLYMHYANFNYCNFYNNSSGVYAIYYANFNYCNVTNNNTGIVSCGGNLNNCNINNNRTGATDFVGSIINCNIFDNDTGLYVSEGYNKFFNTHIYSNSVEGLEIDELGGGEDSVLNCQIVNNGIGLNYSNFGGPTDIIKYNVIDNNNIGILLGAYDSCRIVCNKICNNTTYDLKYTYSTNIHLPGNYWCTIDSASTELVIYDGYDNASYGLVSFMPLDTLNCYLSGSCSSFFYLYPDTTIPHHYYAVNMATGVPPLKYLWSWGDGKTDSIAYPNHTYAKAGYYNICLKITDSTGCTHSYCDSTYLSKHLSSMIYVNVIPSVPTGIMANHTSSITFSLFPNPAINNLTIETQQQATIEITNIQGQVIKQQTTNTETTNINVSALAKGMYFVEVKTEKGIAVKKFVKE